MQPALNIAVPALSEKEADLTIRGRDIVMVGLQPWYFPTGCNSKDIAVRLAQHNRVLYVNFPLKRKVYWAKIPDPKLEQHISLLKNKGPQIKAIADNLWEYYPNSLIESVNWLPFTPAMQFVNYFNNRQFANDIRHAMRELGFKNVILFNDNDVYNGYNLKELLSPELYIYYFRDFLQGYTYWKKHTQVLEPKLIRKADLVVANSVFYADYARQFNPQSYYIGQGCNFDFFDYRKSFSRPADLPVSGGPMIGYIGALDSARLDLRIISLTAKANPKWNIVLVGPEDDVFKQSALHQIPNVFFLGGKPFAELASYVQCFDVCINPQLRNTITRGNYPLKVDEYLAMGKPVVATRTEAMKIFEQQVYLADQPEDYPAMIDLALADRGENKALERIAFAHSHTWENCMVEFYRAVDAARTNKTH